MSDYGKILMSTANAVGASLKKKMGSLTGFAPVDWAETINKLGNKLPERTVSGAVCSFSDGADDVPIKTATFNIDPTLDGVSAVNVTACGKNLFDETALTVDNTLVTSTGGTQSNSAYKSTDYIPMKAGTYTMSGVGSGDNQTANIRFRLVSYDMTPSKTFIAMDANSYGAIAVGTGYNVSFTLATDCYVRISCRKELIEKLMIETGNSATTYASYSATTRTISLGQTVYGGSVTVDEDGACELEETFSSKVDLGSLTWSKNANNRFYSWDIRYVVKPSANNEVSTILCEGFTVDTWNNAYINGTVDDSICISKDGAIGVNCTTYASYTEAQFKSAVSGIYISYPLATPTQTDLDPITPINTFLGTNNLWANTGDSEVTYFAQPNVPTEVLYKGQISTTSDYATANFTESVEDDVDILVKVYCPARSAVDYKVIKVSDIGNGLNVGFNLHTTVNCTITKTSIASYQYSGDYYDIYADVLAYDSAIFN